MTSTWTRSCVLAVYEDDIVTSLTVTDRSMHEQSFPGIKRSSLLLRLSLRLCAAVQTEVSARHAEMCIPMWVSEEWEKERNSWVLSA